MSLLKNVEENISGLSFLILLFWHNNNKQTLAKTEKEKKKKICLCSQGSFAMFSLHHYKIHFIPLEIVEKRNTVALVVCKWRRLRRKASLDIFSQGNQKEYTNIYLRKKNSQGKFIFTLENEKRIHKLPYWST